jgi:hypothetical protein
VLLDIMPPADDDSLPPASRGAFSRGGASASAQPSDSSSSDSSPDSSADRRALLEKSKRRGGRGAPRPAWLSYFLRLCCLPCKLAGVRTGFEDEAEGYESSSREMLPV